MPDNLTSPNGLFIALPDHAVISFAGPDATAFAQAQFANDVATLGQAQWQWNTWLTPKGRVIMVFALLKLSAEELLLIVPDYDADAFCTDLRRFVFRRKLAIASREELMVAGALRPPVSARNAQIAREDGAIEIDYSGAGGPRTLRIGSGFSAASADFTAHWRRYDLQHGRVRLPEAQREHWTPQQLSLDRLHAYSVRKGCYPGQEIVARTHFLGKAKRALALLETSASTAPGAEVAAGGQAVGSVACTAGTLSLAVLPLDRQDTTLQVDGQFALERPLLAGLERS